MRRALPLLLLLACACGGAPRVRFGRDACFIDDAPVGIAQVEGEEARISQRMTQRQPLFVGVGLLVVLLAGAGYILRVVDILAARSADGTGFVDRLRLALDRHRAYPARYFSIVGGSFALLLLACGFYGALDSDRRAGERDLGLLQFCHLALRSADERDVLSRQKENLAALAATAGQIRALVGQLPPDEQQKAQLVIRRISEQLDRPDKALSDSLDRNAQASAAVREQTERVERGISDVAAGVGALKGVPAALAGLERSQQGVGETLKAVSAQLDQGAKSEADQRAAFAAFAQKIDARLGAVDAELDRGARSETDQRAGLAALAKRLDALEARSRPQPQAAPAPPPAPKPASG
jgi:hypothetical protein